MTAPQQPPLAIAPYLRDPCAYAVEHWLSGCHSLEVAMQRQQYFIRALQDPRGDAYLQQVPQLRKLIAEEVLYGPAIARQQKLRLDDLANALLAYAPDETKLRQLFSDPDFASTPIHATCVASSGAGSTAYALAHLARNDVAMHAKLTLLYEAFDKIDQAFQALAMKSPLIQGDVERQQAAIRAQETPAPMLPRVFDATNRPSYAKGYPAPANPINERTRQQPSSVWVARTREAPSQPEQQR